MKAITIYNPWAKLLSTCQKQYETRSWSPFVGHTTGAVETYDPLAIHAGKKEFSHEWLQAWLDRSIERYIATRIAFSLDDVHPRFRAEVLRQGCNRINGHVLGYAKRVIVHKIDTPFLDRLEPKERALGDFRLGRFAWELIDVVRLNEPVIANGRQKIWEWIP